MIADVKVIILASPGFLREDFRTFMLAEATRTSNKVSALLQRTHVHYCIRVCLERVAFYVRVACLLRANIFKICVQSVSKTFTSVLQSFETHRAHE